jgi:hypothetical protein
MKIAVEYVRKPVRFFLAAFLWSHALFIVNFQAAFIPRLARFARLTTSEAVLFALLTVFSFLTASGFWRTLGNVAYVYFFPFVLLYYLSYACFRLLVVVWRWFKPEVKSHTIEVKQPTLPISVPPPDHYTHSETKGTRETIKSVALVLLRPVRKFTFLWCLLLLITTHVQLLWLSLVVVFLHLIRAVFRAVKIIWFSQGWIARIAGITRTTVENTLGKLADVTRESAPTDELKNLWNTVSAYEKTFRFLTKPSVVSRWAWLLCAVVLISGYIYLAFVFSFVYYGMARISGAAFPWPESIVTSLFIPFFVSDLPKIAGLKLLGGVHCTLIVTVGVGSVVRYFRRQLQSIRTVATLVSVRFNDASVREKYSILQEKFATPAVDTAISTNPAPRP